MNNDELRKRAEERLVARPPAKTAANDLGRLVHELQVHQIELEMQNEELVRAHLELEATLRRKTDLFDFAPIGYVVLDKQGAILEANFEAARMLGAPRGKLGGARLASFVIEAHRVPLADLLDEALVADEESRPRSMLDVELGVDEDDGHDGHEVRLIASRLSGDEHRMLVAMHDVTARKRAERALQEEVRGRDQFLAALSHELRNPLASVRTSLEVFARVDPSAKEARKAMDTVNRQADHLTNIVDDLLDVTRVSTGKIQLERAATDLRTLVRTTVEDHRYQFEQRGIALDVGLAAEPLWVDADSMRLTQVFTNLLVNAMKFTPRGGHVAIHVRAENQAIVSVRDDGAGMAPELCERIFAPFVQGPQPLDRTLGGLGLGLAMVKGLVELHGGTVKARSRGPGHGSEFEVRLPIVQAPEVAAEPRPQVRSTVSRRVLVIDDNVENAEALGDLLTLAGHEVRIANDGPSGLTLAREFHPEVVFCDIGLPEMDGYEVAHRMRSDDALRDAYLVALSGYVRAEDRARSAEAGFDHHLAKPASWDAIERLVTAPRR
jgi:two-component system CheB/CheR fusion protein